MRSWCGDALGAAVPVRRRVERRPVGPVRGGVREPPSGGARRPGDWWSPAGAVASLFGVYGSPEWRRLGRIGVCSGSGSPRSDARPAGTATRGPGGPAAPVLRCAQSVLRRVSIAPVPRAVPTPLPHVAPGRGLGSATRTAGPWQGQNGWSTRRGGGQSQSTCPPAGHGVGADDAWVPLRGAGCDRVDPTSLRSRRGPRHPARVAPPARRRTRKSPRRRRGPISAERGGTSPPRSSPRGRG